MHRLLPILCCLMLVGCGEKSSSSDSQAERTTTSSTTTTVSSTTIAPRTTTTTATTTTPESTTTAISTRYTFPTTEISLEQGGKGGQEHAEDPQPLYFRYRFSADGIAMRLAGGTYQFLPYAFADADLERVAENYYLADFNFDEHLDLAVPTLFGVQNTQYSVYLWNPDTQKYLADAVTFPNPIVRTESQQILCPYHDSATKSGIDVYVQNETAFTKIIGYVADFETLTLTKTPSGALAETESFASVEALSDALSQLLA